MATGEFIGNSTAVSSASIASNLDAFQVIYGNNLTTSNSNNFSLNYNPQGLTGFLNSVVAPDGTTTATKLVIPNSNSWVINFGEPATAANGRQYIVTSLFIKIPNQSISGNFYINPGRATSTGANIQGIFTVSKGVVTPFNGNVYVEKHLNGWYRLCIPFISTKSYSGLGLATTFSKNTLNTNTNDEIWLWGLQHEYGTVATPYVPTTNAAKFKPSALNLFFSELADLRPKAPNLVKYSNLKDSTDSGWLNTTVGADMGIDYSVEDPTGRRGVRKVYIIDDTTSVPFRINRYSYLDWSGSIGAGSNQTNYAGQIWIKLADSGANINVGSIQINDVTVKLFSAQPITSSWQLYQFTGNTFGQPYQFIDLEIPVTNRAIHIYGAQLEFGTSNSTYAETTANKLVGIYSNNYFDITNLTTSRDLEPVASGNLIKYSHTFSDANWTKNAGTSLNQPDPFGGTNAILCAGNAATSYTNLGQSITSWFNPAKVYTVSFYTKPYGNTDGLLFAFSGGAFTGDDFVKLNWSTATIDYSSGLNLISSNVSPIGNSWYRVSATVSVYKSGRSSIGIWAKAGYNGIARTNSEGCYIYGVQVEEGYNLSAYIPTSASSVYTSTMLLSNASTKYTVLSDMIPTPGSNLITNSEDLSTKAPQGATVTANAIVAPDGTLTADKLVENLDTSAAHRISIGVSLKGYTTLSFYVKAGERTAIQVYHEQYEKSTGWTSSYCLWNNLNTTPNRQTFSANSPQPSMRNIDSTYTSVGNGWYRITHTTYNDSSFTDNTSWYIAIANSSNAVYYNGDGSSGLYIWGIQLDNNIVASAYTKTTSNSINGFSSVPNIKKSKLDDVSITTAPTLNIDYTKGILDPKLTFARVDATTCATRINPRGLMETVATGVPRFNYDPTTLKCKGILIEEQRANLVLNSDDASLWGGTNDIASVINNAYGVDGMLSAYTVTEGVLNSASKGPYSTTFTANQAITGSMYLKYSGVPWIRLALADANAIADGANAWFNIQTGTLGSCTARSANASNYSSSITTAGNGWYRCTITCIINATATSAVLLAITQQGDANTNRVANGSYIVGKAQIEVGTKATSYIPNTVSSNTRGADKLSLGGTEFTNTWYYGEGTMIVEIDNDVTNGTVMQLSSGNGNYSYWFSKTSSGSQMTIANGVYASASSSNIVNQNIHRLASSWSANGSIRTCIDGQSVASATYTKGLPHVTGGFRFGSDNLVAGWINGHLRSSVYYTKQLPDTVMQNTTSISNPISIGSISNNRISGEVSDLVTTGQNLLTNSEFMGTYTTHYPGWGFISSNPYNGITITATKGNYQGMSGVFYRYSGTAISSVESSFTNISIPSHKGSKYVLSAYMALVDGSLPTTGYNLHTVGRNKSGSLVEQNNYFITNMSSNISRYATNPVTMAFSNTEFVNVKFRVDSIMNEVINFTIFMSSPQLNYGDTATVYTATGLSDYTYNRVGIYAKIFGELTDLIKSLSATSTYYAEIADLVKSISSSSSHYADLFKQYISKYFYNKPVSKPTFTTTSKTGNLTAYTRLTNSFLSRAAKVFSKQNNSTPTYVASVRAVPDLVKPSASVTFTVTGKTKTFIKEA